MGRIRCVVVGTLFALVVVVPPATAACMEQRDAARRWHEARPEGQPPASRSRSGLRMLARHRGSAWAEGGNTMKPVSVAGVLTPS